ncbi:MAG: bifunctional 5,10-methylenetetrahydrofolate dehydrogenase/5,10-methenyltetrahydrofolate cyclohydrolase [Clostridia bacterium]|nr:bifunctional 5,10-methylenetetrahydrofolate dehydrogenase/5,10-methenyltetrahydrofolate cyclohydrolase [Clostridia bacterium]
MSNVLRGKAVADAMDVETTARVEALKAKGVEPCIGILRVGEREDDLAYERGALKRAEKNGVAVKQVLLPADASQADLLAAIKDLNEDSSVHGVLMFRPLPKQMDEAEACEALLPEKDLDGITRGSMASIYSGTGAGFAPCTAEGCIELLKYYGVEMSGKRAVVIGRSLVIGKPVAMLLMANNATVTVCHSRTQNMPDVVKEADIVICALGRGEMIDGKYFREGQTVLDVGINWSEEKGKLVGDVLFEEAEPIVEAITPVPGGCGSATTAVLIRHVVEAAEKA